MSSIRILDVNKDYVEIPLLKSGKKAKAIVHPGMGSKYGALNYVVMEPGDENILHVHPNSDDVIYILQGEGVVVDGDGNENSFKQWDVIFCSVRDFSCGEGPWQPGVHSHWWATTSRYGYVYSRVER
jgi:hypothetical protein